MDDYTVWKEIILYYNCIIWVIIVNACSILILHVGHQNKKNPHRRDGSVLLRQ